MPLGRFGTDVRGPGVERTLGRVKYDKTPDEPRSSSGFRVTPARRDVATMRANEPDVRRAQAERAVARQAAGIPASSSPGFGAIRQADGTGPTTTIGLQQRPDGAFVQAPGTDMMSWQGGQQVANPQRGGFVRATQPQPQMDALTQAKLATAQLAGVDVGNPLVQQAAINPEITPARFQSMIQPTVPEETGPSPRQQINWQYQDLQAGERDAERRAAELEDLLRKDYNFDPRTQTPADLVQNVGPQSTVGRTVENVRGMYQPGYRQRTVGEQQIKNPDAHQIYRDYIQAQAEAQQLRQQREALMQGGQQQSQPQQAQPQQSPGQQQGATPQGDQSVEAMSNEDLIRALMEE